MSRDQFPTLLNKKATMLGSLTRTDLLVVGLSYLFLSRMKVSGTYSLFTIMTILILMKLVQRRILKGFFAHLFDHKKLSWQFKFGEKHE